MICGEDFQIFFFCYKALSQRVKGSLSSTSLALISSSYGRNKKGTLRLTVFLGWQETAEQAGCMHGRKVGGTIRFSSAGAITLGGQRLPRLGTQM